MHNSFKGSRFSYKWLISCFLSRKQQKIRKIKYLLNIIYLFLMIFLIKKVTYIACINDSNGINKDITKTCRYLRERPFYNSIAKIYLNYIFLFAWKRDPSSPFDVYLSLTIFLFELDTNYHLLWSLKCEKYNLLCKNLNQTYIFLTCAFTIFFFFQLFQYHLNVMICTYTRARRISLS